ncbi:MAG: HAD hydrolase-like protein, partial [Bdellovibrionales bacterium]|nr:HAD hydrolase-like protein [Bdellovibrionales bacterium]
MPIFFDLDGTLSDPAEGIFASLRFALAEIGQPLTITDSDLRSCIGPPLRDIFRHLLNTDEQEKIEQAVEAYRRRFASTGLFENKLYPGITQLLSSLHARNQKLYVTTAKPHLYARRILEHFKIDNYFDAVFGPELNGARGTKREVVKHALDLLTLEPSQVILVGDSHYDVDAGIFFGLRTVYVSYGFSDVSSLRGLEPDHIIGTVTELEACLM